MTEEERSNYFWGFITGFLIVLTFRVAWWLLKVIVRTLVFIAGAALELYRALRTKRRFAAIERADALVAERRVDEALPIVRQVLGSGDPLVQPWAWYSLGTTLEAGCRWDEALDAFRQAAASGNPEVVPLGVLGQADVLYFGQRRWDEAEALYRQLLLSEHQTLAEPEARQQLRDGANTALASLLYDRGRFDESADLCERLLEAAPVGSDDANRFAVGLARNRARQGMPEEALAAIAAVTAMGDGCTLGLEHDTRELFRTGSAADVVTEIEASQAYPQAV